MGRDFNKPRKAKASTEVAPVFPGVSVVPQLTGTPLACRIAIGVAIAVVGLLAYFGQKQIGLRGQSVAGVVFFFGIVAMFSSNLRAVNWRTIGWGLALQVMLAILVLQGHVTIDGRTYSVKNGIERIGRLFKALVGFSDQGAEFVFGNLARPDHLEKVYGKDFLFPFAFKALPSILFLSALFTVLYHYGVLQRCVRLMAYIMTYLMRTSGAETLSVAANVFMGQTEAPLLVKPYVGRMTNSELFTLMVSGFAHISGGMMVVYINYGADPTAVLTTSIMACPCSLYLSKLFMPELATPETLGAQVPPEPDKYVNAFHAIVSGTSDGLKLVMNVAAMLIVFIALVAMIDALLGTIKPSLVWLGASESVLRMWPDHLSLQMLLGWLFSPVAFLMGVESPDTQAVGSLLGSKLATNEHVAYLQFRKLMQADPYFITDRSKMLTAFALTGFANFASIGIQLGGIGSLAQERQPDLARLGLRALFVGFTATLLNASIAGILM